MRWRHVSSCSGYITCRTISRTKLGRRLRKKAAISKETESLGALPASSHPVKATLAAFPGIAKRFFALHHGFVSSKIRTLSFPPKSRNTPAGI
ncbi:hypothetical protein MES5069_250233 [Mesorhizobium escarrei]|uniref:Uncharacterized protein n=1 Tax=Mesorhizobium escarrei TaxID=666018 RepID=A0ABM9DWG6_9HYPH|nr:hypothetical protein MES5069_250233 [Mesorhizobium escarrei]